MRAARKPVAAFILTILVSASAALAAPKANRVLDAPFAASAMAVADAEWWVASRGDGVFAIAADKRVRRFDVGALPSAVVHDVAVLRGGLLAATDRGLVIIDRKSGGVQAVNPPDVRHHAAADLVVASATDGYAIFQLTWMEQAIEGEPVSSIWRLRGNSVQAWDPGLGGGLTAMSALATADGCVHLAGVRTRGAVHIPWYARDCRGAVQIAYLLQDAPTGTVGIAGLADALPGGDLTLMLVVQPTANAASRRFVPMQMRGQRLAAHCSKRQYEEPVVGFLRHRDRLLVARRGLGLDVLDCAGSHALTEGDRLADVSAIAPDAHGGVVAATDSALYRVDAGGKATLLAEPVTAVAANALPMQASKDGARVLLGSPTGITELARDRDSWKVRATWQSGAELPAAVYGAACYGNEDDILAIALSKSVMRLSRQNSRARPLRGAESVQAPLDLSCTSRGIWVATGATPTSPRGAGLHFIGVDGAARSVMLKDRQLQPGGSLLAWPDGSIWVGTRSGILHARIDGTSTRLSNERVEALFRNEARGIVAAVGATIQHWNGTRFEPVLFAPRAPPRGALGHPIDVVIDDEARWYILYSGGYIVLLDARRNFLDTLDASDGVPATSRQLLYLPATREILIGTGREGVFTLRIR